MRYFLKLFIMGQTARSQRAVANLQEICEQELAGKYEIVIVDILDRPHLAEEEKIFATPTLIKQLPPPSQRIIGDLSDKSKVLRGLGLHGGEL